MNREDNLRRALLSWLAIPEIKQIIIIDWSSHESIAEKFHEIQDERILYVRVEGEKYWKLTLAFNLGLQYVKYTRLVKLDADIMLKKDFFDAHILRDNFFFRGYNSKARDENERKLNGFLYCYSVDFININGYNEHLHNRYGRDDDDVYLRLMQT